MGHLGRCNAVTEHQPPTCEAGPPSFVSQNGVDDEADVCDVGPAALTADSGRKRSLDDMLQERAALLRLDLAEPEVRAWNGSLLSKRV